jgi:hypothetical protein
MRIDDLRANTLRNALSVAKQQRSWWPFDGGGVRCLQ